jgi:hypothetical protein
MRLGCFGEWVPNIGKVRKSFRFNLDSEKFLAYFFGLELGTDCHGRARALFQRIGEDVP